MAMSAPDSRDTIRHALSGAKRSGDWHQDGGRLASPALLGQTAARARSRSRTHFRPRYSGVASGDRLRSPSPLDGQAGLGQMPPGCREKNPGQASASLP